MTTIEDFCNQLVEIVASTDDDDAMYDAIETLDDNIAENDDISIMTTRNAERNERGDYIMTL